MTKLYVVGIGPGGLNHMTFEAREAISRAEVVVGYHTYLGFIEPLLSGKDVVSSGMTREVERCRKALEAAAQGKTVALVSSGDAGIYGMAGLVLELLEEPGGDGAPEVVVVPGVSALQAAASVLGAPLMHDFAVVSLSDLMTPWDAIERRLALASAGDFVIALYNPRSKGRVRHLEEAQKIILSSRSAATPVGIVRNACRKGEEKTVTTLGDMLSCRVDMFSLVIIGNSATYVDGAGRMVTPRGYGFGTRDSGLGTGMNTGIRETAPGACIKLPENKRVTASTGRFPTAPDFSSPESRIPSPLAASDFSNPESRVPSPGSLMFCGTGSDVGKSVLAAGLCRILSNRGVAVAPFKSQNMALNSAVTPEGGEIGRAQAVQAEACRIPSHVDMNPVLLKPNSDTGSQVIVRGVPVGNMSIREYNRYKPEAFLTIRECFRRLKEQYRFVVIEGAGSIAEINLKADDIANMKVAEMADCPVILVADIDRGGVFAQIVGTLELLEPHERARVKGVIINKFRGDQSLLKPGIEFVEGRTGIPVLGVVPWFSDFRIPDEDSVPLASRKSSPKSFTPQVSIGVIKLPRISNYTDFAPLERRTDVSLAYIEHPNQLDDLDLLIVPGSKSTIPDLLTLHDKGMVAAIRRFAGPVIGICGGYQMLGRRIIDPHGVESEMGEAEGIGLLDVETVMLPVKSTHQVTARLHGTKETTVPPGGAELTGYEIHMGETSRGALARPFAIITTRSGAGVSVEEGAVSPDGRVFGTYIHGIFDNGVFRHGILDSLRRSKGLPSLPEEEEPDPLDLLASHLEKSLDLPRLLALCGIGCVTGGTNDL